MKSAKKIILHIGFHKTGTTYLQKTWSANESVLSQNRIKYLPLHELRDGFTNLTYKRSHDDELRSFVRNSTKDHDVAIFSDENYIGLLTGLKRGSVYPDMASKIRDFLYWAGDDCEVSIYVSIRQYAEWIESVFLQTEENKRVLLRAGGHRNAIEKIKSMMGMFKDENIDSKFVQFMDRNAMRGISWVECLRRLRDAAPNHSITVWPFEAFARNNESIIGLFEKALNVHIPERITKRKNPTDSELMSKILKVAAAEARPEDLFKLRRFLRKNFSTDNGYAKRVFIQGKAREELITRYHRDLNEIKGMEDVNFHCFGFDEVIGHNERLNDPRRK